jgi:hypothetical protein
LAMILNVLLRQKCELMHICRVRRLCVSGGTPG